ncbi:PsiF family protein [Ramlibacter sp.]|uniref:PsiF family protein n=1 Tax=Ramlibacter sp. TaxID=1917967 RepID=UPI00261F4731|nr:PsiF family protein [Ramlibacter sp.]MDB5957495.1 PsiF repeat protein [Ramlibacter sp.]
MKRTAIALAAMLLATAVQAQQLRREPTPQQQLMTTCRYEADTRELKGSEHNRFLGACLAAGRQRQQKVMQECNAEARGKTGEARRAFISECSRR